MSTIAAPQPYIFARADTWPMPAVYADPTGAPVDLSGSVVTGELYLARRPTPILLTVANGGLVVDPTNGKMSFTVAPVITEYATPDPFQPGAVPPAYAYPNRLQVVIQDTLGEAITRGVLPILVFDGRNIPISAFPQNGTATIGAAATQGPPGPAISVNGYTGPVQNLGAHDVGTLTAQEIATAIANAVAAAVAPLQTQLDLLLHRVIVTLQAAPASLGFAGVAAGLTRASTLGVRSSSMSASPGPASMIGTRAAAVAAAALGLTGGAASITGARISQPGGGPSNVADHSDPNNAYLAAMAA